MATKNESLFGIVETIAREAGVAILGIYGSEFSVQEKEDKSPLTVADSVANIIILNRLSDLTPTLPILSEEAVADFTGPDDYGRYWLVDPLDGTKEFVKRNDEFTVNIALIEKGKPVLGVVYAPALDLMYSAADGIGAFKSEAGGPRMPIRVSEYSQGTTWRVVGSRSHAGDSLLTLLRQLGPHELISMGSSLKFCLIAEGSADVYPRFGPTCLWDTAAGQCIVEQAGGAVIQFSGQPLSYGDTTNIVNPFFFVHGYGTMDWGKYLAANTVLREPPGQS